MTQFLLMPGRSRWGWRRTSKIRSHTRRYSCCFWVRYAFCLMRWPTSPGLSARWHYSFGSSWELVPVCHFACLAQLSYRYASDSRNAPENCGLLRPLSICGAKNHCPFRGHLALTGSTLMCWRRCSRNAVRTVGRRKSRLDHRFSLGALQSELPPPWHVWCLNRSAPHKCFDFKSYFFVWWESWVWRGRFACDRDCSRVWARRVPFGSPCHCWAPACG